MSNTHPYVAILTYLKSIPVKRFARFAAFSVNEQCRCVLGTLWGSALARDKWIISSRLDDGTVAHLYASEAVKTWAIAKGLTPAMIVELIAINDEDPNASSPLSTYHAETPHERYVRVIAAIEARIVEAS